MKAARLWIIVPAFLVFALTPVLAIQWVAAFAGLTVLLSAVYSRHTRTRIVVTRIPSVLSCFRHQTEQIHIRIVNRGLLPVAHLSLSEPTGNLTAEGRTARVVSLPGKGSISMRYTVKGTQRGSFTTGPLRIKAADPLGLFPWHIEAGGVTSVSVYPALHRLILPRSRGLPAGNLTSSNRLYADPTRYRGLRDYVRGDDIRHISWKATARTGSLKTVEHLPAMYFPTTVILNLRSEDYARPGRYAAVERCIECAAALLRDAADSGQSFACVLSASIGGVVRNTGFPAGNGHEHMVLMLRAMADAEIAPGRMDASDVLRAIGPVSPGSRICYVGPALAPSQLLLLDAAVKPHADLLLFFAREKRHMPAVVMPLPFYRIPDTGVFNFE